MTDRTSDAITKAHRAMTIYATDNFRETVGGLPGINQSAKIHGAVHRDIRARELVGNNNEDPAITLAKLQELYRLSQV